MRLFFTGKLPAAGVASRGAAPAMHTLLRWPLLTILIAGLISHARAVPSFPGAEGFGSVTAGGRGGKVYHVTNLKNSGSGSFREGVEAGGARTIVFDVSGIIQLTEGLEIKNPSITIAGQTAPGEGIIVAGVEVDGDMISMTGGVSEVLVRYMRFRRGFNKVKWADWMAQGEHYNYPGPQGQCFVGMDARKNIMMDHISVSWGMDENFSMYRWQGPSGLLPTKNMTVQWCLNAEALNAGNHAFANTWGGEGANFHHNLLACCVGRNPSISFSHFLDFRNNTIFNWRDRSMDGGGIEAHVNVINNYYKPGPATGYTWDWGAPAPELKVRIVKPEIRDWGPDFGLSKARYAGPGIIGWWYVDGNIVEGYPEVSSDNWEGKSQVSGDYYTGVQWDAIVKPYPGVGPETGESHPEWEGETMYDHPEWARSDTMITHVEQPENPKDPDDGENGETFVMPDLPGIATQSTMTAYQSVLEGSGAIYPVRDAVDKRVVEMVTAGEATAGSRNNGIIDHPDDVGGYPEIAEEHRPSDWDTDRDGMPDIWESTRGLNPEDAADRNDDYDNDDYTNLEEYLNDIGAFKAVRAVVWDGEKDGRYARIENWDIAFQPSRFDTAIIGNASVEVDAIDQHAGILRLTDGATLDIVKGWLEVAESLEVDTGCTAVIGTDGSCVAGDVVNSGTMRLTGDAGLTVDGAFTNNGVLDIATWNGSLPPDFVNNGTVLDGGSGISVATEKSAMVTFNVSISGGTLRLHTPHGNKAGTTVTIYTIQGRIIRTWSFSRLNGRGSIPLRPELGNGIYIARVTAGSSNLCEKFTVEK